ncbi:UDP-3-O-acyl-N-acetylglucosamine deacetylase [Kiritimatiella glycovorans]|uniref:UDP-3-O-acyl-N-acetylglucosamine deacetylase n=1 Tax=Kiritimatiella glycovorans TaxID=1307763 RepID=A0A0G3EAA7_9BACT|nr:UDP-3-O-acyl-N-acetylglucosamine deacetylase [Kiritimatiella glycovorans]AKJ63376.1 UDP-3-O-[3-hydroxymyristoyl] N-acetylglucosamine deacetylase [Kiritimatiella glycovorans]
MGDRALLRESAERFVRIPVDLDLGSDEPVAAPGPQCTLDEPVTLSGPGTFSHKGTTTVRLEPTDGPGWWLNRSDIPDALPLRVSVRNVWTTGAIVSNIVLRSGPPSNYVRMVEHIIALRYGLGVDNLMIRIDSGDPPLFNQGSMNIVEALDAGGRREQSRPRNFVTVKEPVTVVGSHGQFLHVAPCTGSVPAFNADCALAFPNAIGDQRIRFPVTGPHVRHGAVARTNTTFARMLYCRSIGKIFANIRNLGYTRENILIAGRNRYVNEPRLVHEGKSLEAAWHRGVLDLLAAFSLIEDGLFVGDVTSYKAGHRLDVALITRLYLQDLLTPYTPGGGA